MRSRLNEHSTSIEIRSGKGSVTEGVSETRITVDTSFWNQYEIVETLALPSATVRTSETIALAKSEVRLVFQEPLPSEADASYRLALDPLEDSDGGPVMCSHPLFVNAILAVQFLIAKRN